MPSIWTDFIKKFSEKHNIKYACALSKYKEPLRKAYKLFKDGKEWYEPMTSEILIGGANTWTNFVKEYAVKKNTTYGCALSDIGIKNAYKLFKDGKEWFLIEMKEEPKKEAPKEEVSNKDKIIQIYYDKIKSLTKSNIDAIYKLYGLYTPKNNNISKSYNISGIAYDLVKSLYDGSLSEYGATGLKDIDVILEEELHKKKGAFKPNLASEGYFIKKKEERDKVPKEAPKKEAPKKEEIKKEVPKKEAPKKEAPKKEEIKKEAPKKAPKKAIVDQKANDKLLIDNWTDDNLPILFLQLKPQAYLNMEKKVNELTEIDKSTQRNKGMVVVGFLAYFISDILNELFEKYGSNKKSADIILNGLAEITLYMNEDEDISVEDYSPLYRYLKIKNKEKLDKSIKFI